MLKACGAFPEEMSSAPRNHNQWFPPPVTPVLEGPTCCSCLCGEKASYGAHTYAEAHRATQNEKVTSTQASQGWTDSLVLKSTDCSYK